MTPRRPKKPPAEPRPKRDRSNPSEPTVDDPSEDRYILPDGQIVAIDDVEIIYTFLAGLEKDPGKLKGLLWGLARECGESGRYDGAFGYVEKISTLEQDPDARAHCFLTMGQLFEGKRDFQAAVDAYSRAFTLPARENDTWYFLNNNLGYSLNQIGDHDEAEPRCRKAIAINPDRHNAHKNLGISLQGQGRYLEAAQSLLRAARVAREDTRALDHLEKLLSEHEEIGTDHPEILQAVQECREVVRKARAERLM
jgi:tetratricopeptide (TPR) repeat protein